MLIERDSMLSGKLSTMDLDVTQDQIKRWQSGELIQNVMPHLKPYEREFLISGMSKQEQEEMFREDE